MSKLPYPATKALLEYLGYDAKEIATEGLDSIRFRRFIFDASGNWLVDQYGPVTETERWSDRGVDGWMIEAVFKAEKENQDVTD